MKERCAKSVMATTVVYAATLLAGCAANTSQIAPERVSPLEYEEYSCEQIADEAQKVARRAQEIGAKVDKTAADDDAQTAIGLIFFWPALFFLEGSDTSDTQEYARLRGQFEALEEISVKKGCGIEFKELAPVGTGKTHVPPATETE